MRVLIVGEQEPPPPARGGARGGGSGRRAAPGERPRAAHDDQVGELAAALIAFERLLADEPPDAVLLVSASNLALAAVLVATKLQIPVAARWKRRRRTGPRS